MNSYSYGETIVPVRVRHRIHVEDFGYGYKATRLRLRGRHTSLVARRAQRKSIKFGKVAHGIFTGFLVVAFSAGSSGLVLLAAAFESHMVNVTAAISQIDPPALTPPGNIPWYNLVGGTDLTGTVDVFLSDADIDATHIYYTFGDGADPLAIPNPVCGQTGLNGGGGLKGDVEIVPLSLVSTTTIKAIACDGDTSDAHHSVINTKVYTFLNECPAVGVDFPANFAVQAGGSSDSANDDFLASAGIEVNGNVRSNHDIRASGGGDNRDINGDAIAGNDVQESFFTISGSVVEGAVAQALPDIQIPVWQDRAKLGGTVNGSLFFPTGTSGIELGPIEILGNVIFQGSNDAIVKGPLYIHGNLVVDENTTITQDPAFGNQFATIIVDGTIDIDNNVEFVGNGSGAGSGAFLLVSNAAAQAGNNAAIEVSNDANPLGDVVLYASEGDVHVNPNRTLLAVFAAHGTAVANPAIDFDSNVQVNYRTLPSVIGCGEQFDTLQQVVINEFMPNPSGDDKGAAGLPLDGEWVELYNGSTVPVNVNGWVLYDSNDANELVISLANVASSTTTICPECYLVVYRDGDSDFALNNSGSDSVRLYSGDIGLGGSLVDMHAYTYPSGAGEGKSFARIPDGTANWVDPEPTPGDSNEEFFDPDTTPTEPIVYESEPYIDPGVIEEEPTAQAGIVEEVNPPAEEESTVTDEASTVEPPASQGEPLIEPEGSLEPEQPATTEESVITEEPTAVPEPPSPPEVDTASQRETLIEPEGSSEPERPAVIEEAVL